MQDKNLEKNLPAPMDIGSMNRLTIRCISETGWHDTPTLLSDITAVGGRNLQDLNQYDLDQWPPFGHLHSDNAAGSSALVEARYDDGVRRFLFDSGWNPEWMDKRFAEEGIDKMLEAGEIEAVVISHEHFDHFWGIGSAVRHRPDVPIHVPEGFHREGFQLMEKVGHTGPVHVIPTNEPIRLAPGLAVVNFPMETLGHVQGENVLYARIAGKGLAMITGCCHGGALNLLDYGQHTFRDRMYAVYGGLHVSPFGEWNDENEKVVQGIAKYDIAHFGCNHCTGEKTVERMVELGLPVSRGSARHGSKSDLYLGNGDVFTV